MSKGRTKTSKGSKKAQILEVWESMGPASSVADVLAECVRRNVWSNEERQQLAIRSMHGQVRDTLNGVDADQVPLSLIRMSYEEDEDGQVQEVTLHVQKEFWTAEDAEFSIRRRVRQLRGDYAKLEKLIEFCAERWPETDWWSLVPFRVEE